MGMVQRNTACDHLNKHLDDISYICCVGNIYFDIERVEPEKSISL